MACLLDQSKYLRVAALDRPINISRINFNLFFKLTVILVLLIENLLFLAILLVVVSAQHVTLPHSNRCQLLFRHFKCSTCRIILTCFFYWRTRSMPHQLKNMGGFRSIDYLLFLQKLYVIIVRHEGRCHNRND